MSEQKPGNSDVIHRFNEAFVLVIYIDGIVVSDHHIIAAVGRLVHLFVFDTMSEWEYGHLNTVVNASDFKDSMD